MSELVISTSDGATAATIENGIQAVDDLEAVDVRRRPGRTTDGEITQAEAIAELAEAYTGWSA